MPGTNLTRDEAQQRSQLVEVGDYRVAVQLSATEATFDTQVTARFTCRQPGAQTFLDFIGESVSHVELNGRVLDPAQVYDGARITLPDLAADNDVVVRGAGRYLNSGEGLHRFVDPVDGEAYLYTQFEVAECRRVFPVFDQPDLKAAFQFTVTAPAHWLVISNQPTPQPQPAGDNLATWRFTPTPRISCYIAALIAGPYEGVRGEYQDGDRVIPLGVYARRSLAPYLQADQLLELTRQGFAFFTEEFGYPYPFEKYDQVFTPEYNMGAMENAGAVTFNELYVFRAKVPEALVERRALTLLHEMAHMWFGNLVTMRWWDDLWLNESFAEWASTTAQSEATPWREAWTTFAIAEKAWAYSQDQLSSTHPIAADIRSLEDVQVNFDGITYAKGASVLKQLVAYVGREAFREGLRAYFRRHAWGNTSITDLLAELEATSGRDLTGWSRLWLETAGVGTVRAQLTTDESGIITAAEVHQSAPAEHPTLRPHRIGIGLYTLDPAGESLQRTTYLETDIDGPCTPVPQLLGHRHPDLLLVNDEDLAYTKIRLDEPSLATAMNHITGISDSLPRALVLGALWDMTRDAEMAGRDFVDVALRALTIERDSTLLRTLLSQLHTTVTVYLAPAARPAALTRVTDALRELVLGAEPGSSGQLQLISAFCLYAQDADDLAWLRGLYDGTRTLPGLVLDTEMRWTLLTALAAGGDAHEADIEAEAARDNTATGRERAVRALAARPTAQAKQDAWQQAVDNPGLANQTVDALWQGFGRVHDVKLLEPYVERYHDGLRRIWSQRTHAIAESLVEGFYPVRLANPSLLAATEDWLAANLDAPVGLTRLVGENRDVVKRALAAQARDAQCDA